MAEFWMIFRLKSAEDRLKLNQAVLPDLAADVITYNRKLLEKDPANGRAWMGIGNALYALGQNERALDAFRRALQFDAKLDDAHYYLGLIGYDARDFERARAEFESAIAINRMNYKAHGYLGLVYLNLRDFEKAESSLLEALRVNPDDQVAQNNLELVRNARSRAVGPP
jgi:tetratricopeptide (TPR) repeat protein